MKRTPLKRRTPLRARKRMVRKPSRRLNSPDHEPEYASRVRKLPCSAAPLGWCRGPIVAHHPRHLAPGVGRKAPDRCAVPLCDGHHKDLHALTGDFKGCKREYMRGLQDAWVARTQMQLGVK